jgi:hypothetical protein
MKIHLRDDDKSRYSRLHISGLDLDFAQYYVGVILKKGWHYEPWEKRGTIYLQQSAFMSALVIAYARSIGWPNFPPHLKEFSDQEKLLHKRMMELRNKVYAHSDLDKYSAVPWRKGRFSTDIVGAPVLRISAEEAALLKRMIQKLQLAIRRSMAEIVPNAS